MQRPLSFYLETYITADERTTKGPQREVRLAESFGMRAANLLTPMHGDDARSVEQSLYYYARRAGHWGLKAQGEPALGVVCTYYRRA